MVAKRLATIIPLVVLTSAVLAACGGGTTRTVVRVVTRPASAATTTSSAGTTATPTTTSTSAGPAQPVAQQRPKPLATETLRISCTPGATIRLTVFALRVQGRLMTLEMGLTPNNFPLPGPGVDPAVQVLAQQCGDEAFVVSLIDPVHLRRYSVVSDAAGNALAPNDLRADNGHTVVGDWVFAAPPRNVKTLNLQAGDFTTINNIPVQR